MIEEITKITGKSGIVQNFGLVMIWVSPRGRPPQVVPGRASGIKMVGMAQVGAPLSQDGMAVHPDCWCVCLCYLHFAPENPEDGKQRYDIWVSPRGRPHMPTQPEHCLLIRLALPF